MAGVVRLSKLKKPTKALFTMTDTAKSRLRHLMSQHASKKGNVPAAIKVGVRKGGCSGFVYTLQFADSVQASDEVVQDEDLTVIVDPKAYMAIVGTEMDYLSTKLKSEFVFTNPNATGTCGCGESFTTGPVAPSAIGIPNPHYRPPEASSTSKAVNPTLVQATEVPANAPLVNFPAANPGNGARISEDELLQSCTK